MATTQGIKLDDKTLSRLKALAEKKSRSSHWLMRAAIEKYLDREEQYEQEKIEDMARWDRYVTTGKSIDNEKVVGWLSDLAHAKDTPWPRVKWLPEAVGDAERLYAFLRAQDIDASVRAAGCILEGARLLGTSPRIGRPMPDETGRRELFIAFGAGAYVLRYMLESEDTAVVIRVWHSKENRE